MNYLYVQIGGFNIKISLEKDKNNDPSISFLKNRMEVELFAYLKDFINLENTNKTDFEIILNSVYSEETARKIHDNKEYIQIFENISNKKMLIPYHISYLQFEIILKNVLNTLLTNHQGFAIHSSSVKIGKEAYLFLGNSGAGKSTIAELLNKEYQALSDDVSLVRKINSKYYVFQTPFITRARWIETNTTSYVLKKVFFLKKSKEYSIKKISNQSLITKKVVSQVFVSKNYDQKKIKNVINFINTFNQFNDLSFAKDEKELIKLISNTLHE